MSYKEIPAGYQNHPMAFEKLVVQDASGILTAQFQNADFKRRLPVNTVEAVSRGQFPELNISVAESAQALLAFEHVHS